MEINCSLTSLLGSSSPSINIFIYISCNCVVLLFSIVFCLKINALILLKAVTCTRKSVNINERVRPSVFDKDYLTPEEKEAAAKYDIEKELGIAFTSGGSIQNETVN